MAKKLNVVYGWREGRRPHEWLYHLHWIRNTGRPSFQTSIVIWMTRQEAETANRSLHLKTGLQWFDSGEMPRQS